MEKPRYPSKNMRIMQGYQEGSHKDTFAIDDYGKNNGIEKIHAPYTGIIKKIYPNDANEVWLESVNEVEYPDGTIDYMTIMFAHADDISDLFVGKIISQGKAFYSEGTKGNITGNHCHIECSKGKFTGSGWHKTASGYYSVNNSKKPEECLWIDDSITIINPHNYKFSKVIDEPSKEINQQPESAREEIPLLKEEKQKNQPLINENKTQKKQSLTIENKTEKSQPSSEELPIFICKKKGLYGIYLNEGQKLYIK